MLTKQGVAITFLAHYIDSTNLDSETGLTVVVDVYEGTNGTPIVSGASAPEIGTSGVYAYTLASGSVDADTLYWAVFRTTSTAVVQKHLPSLWVVGTTLKAVDDVTNVGADVRTELTTELARIDTTISSRATPAQVNTEVVDALSTDTYAEPSSVPAATASLAAKLGWLFTLARNKITQTSTTQTLRNDADGANIGTSAVSDNGTTFTRNEWS